MCSCSRSREFRPKAARWGRSPPPASGRGLRKNCEPLAFRCPQTSSSRRSSTCAVRGNTRPAGIVGQRDIARSGPPRLENLTPASGADRYREAPQMASFDALISAMRTTVALDDDLVRIAQEFTGVAEKTALIREALKALIERESARRLASLEGTMPKLKNIPRRSPGTN